MSRYGFNGKEQDPEVSGEGTQYDYGFRIYDPRIVRFKSVDPSARLFPWNSPYSYAEGDLIRSIDLDGLEKYIVTNAYDAQNRIVRKTIVTVVSKDDSKTIVDMDFKYAHGGKDVTANNVLVYDIQANGSYTKTERSELDKSDQTFYDTYKRNRHENTPGTSFLIGGTGTGIETEPFDAKRYSKEEYNYVGAGANYTYPPPQVNTVPGPTQTVNQNVTVNFTPTLPTFGPGGAATVNAAAAQVPPNSVTPGPVVAIPGGTQQTTTRVRSTITVNLLTNNNATSPTPVGTGAQLQDARFRTIRQQLINQGIPAGNIIRGTTQFGVPTTQMNGNVNQVNFNIRTTTTQRTTTVTNTPTQVTGF